MSEEEPVISTALSRREWKLPVAQLANCSERRIRYRALSTTRNRCPAKGAGVFLSIAGASRSFFGSPAACAFSAEFWVFPFNSSFSLPATSLTVLPEWIDGPEHIRRYAR